MFATATLALGEIGAAEKRELRCRAGCSDSFCRAGIPATINERRRALNQCRLGRRYWTRPRLCEVICYMDPQVRRATFDIRKFLMSKHAPAVYGDNLPGRIAGRRAL